MRNRLAGTWNLLLKKYKNYSRKTLGYIDRRPLKSFFIALGVVLLLIVLGNLLPKPKQEVIKTESIKQVDVYHIGVSPKISVTAQIKKSGVLQIMAQVPGIVNFIHAYEGTKVSKGAPLLNIASNYYGGNAASVSRQIAKQQYDSTLATYFTQKEVIQKQKQQAQKTDETDDQLRDISSKSIAQTDDLIKLNEQILQTIDQDLALLVPTSQDYKDLQRLKSQLMASTNQAKASLRESQYETAGDKPLAQIADLTREVAIKQLEIQEKQLDINKEVSRLQLALAQVNEGMYFPVAPFASIVERVFVKPFEAVTPGTPLMIISQTIDDPITAVAFVSKDIASRVSLFEPSILHIGENIEMITPSFVSTDAVQGTLYAVYYPIPEALNKNLTNEGFITIEIPLGFPDTTSAAPFVPIDAIFQTRTTSYLFVVDGDKAHVKEVKLGQVMGRFVEIEQGIDGSEGVILNRNVIEGDLVKQN